MLTRLSAVLRARSDSEHVMSANRAVFCLVMALFCVLSPSVAWFVGPVLLLTGLPVAALLFVHIVLRPAPNPLRRALALVADMTSISLVMHYGDEATSCFYPLFLWTIFGNGIRFGLRDLAVATAIGFTAFTLVVLTTPFWLTNPSLSVGLVAGTLIVPGYSSHLIENLTKAREAAEQASRAKTRFLANISHDLRTPLQALIGTSELLGATALTPSQDGMVETCLSAGRSLLHMVDGLLRFNQLQEAPTEPQVSTFDPVDPVQQVIRVSAALCHRKSLRLSAHFSPDLPSVLTSDQSRLEEVLLNLVSNAVKFTEAGGVLVTVAPAEPDMLRFEVVDTGIGVATAARQQIFERFVQGDETVRMRFGGSGMGLAICRELVSGLGGRIGLASADGPGSNFWFEIPGAADSHGRPRADGFVHSPVTLHLSAGPARDRFAAAVAQEGRLLVAASDPGPASLIVVTDDLGAAGGETGRRSLRRAKPPGQRQAVILVCGAADTRSTAEARWNADVLLPSTCNPEDIRRVLAICDAVCRVPPRPATSDTGTPTPLPGARVLIVDDNKANRLIFSRILSTGHYETKTADDGEQALVALGQDRFDLVLMDVNMPVIDGLEATRLLRITELGGLRIPIIGLTADGSEETRKECIAVGMDACLTKPVMPDVLLDIVHRTLRTTRPAGRPPGTTEAAGEGETVVVDWTVLQCLDDVGGPEFRAEILSEFESEAFGLISRLEVVVDCLDISQIRHLGHSLASVAANVGAAEVAQFGRHLEACSEPELHRNGQARVEAALDGVRRFLSAAKAGSIDPDDAPGG